jgi:hypothetical protein
MRVGSVLSSFLASLHYMRKDTIDSDGREEEDQGMTNTYFDKVTLLGPAPYGGTITTTTNDPTISRLVGKGYRIVRQWTVTVGSDGKPVSLPLN